MDVVRLHMGTFIIITASLVITCINIFFIPLAYKLYSRTSYVSPFEYQNPGISQYKDRQITEQAPSNIVVNDLTFNEQRDDFISTHFLWSNMMKTLPNFFIAPDHDGKTLPEKLYQENPTIVFVHIPKSAGTTTLECLKHVAEQRKLGKPQSIWFRNYLSIFKSLKSGKHRRKRAYLGVFALGVCDFVNQPCSYFTVFRDPIERTISSYMYCKKKLTDKICHAADARNMTVRQWALHQGSVVFYQLLHNPELCKKQYNVEAADLMKKKDYIKRTKVDIPCWYKQILLLQKRIDKDRRQRILNFILANMKNLFAFIGLTDKYNETLQMLEKVYDLPFYSVCAGDIKNKAVYKISGDNTTDSKTMTVDNLKKNLMEDPEVRRVLYEDMEIYKEAVRIFNKQLDKFKSLSQ
ncbi:uncharacterized protein [Ptychodera flava]|uniref:uncharacterized protein n=1 Tax=Ptychodera flava TaxID=63121 RepID=UPI00396A076A